MSANSTFFLLTRLHRSLSCKEHIACPLALMPHFGWAQSACVLEAAATVQLIEGLFRSVINACRQFLQNIPALSLHQAFSWAVTHHYLLRCCCRQVCHYDCYNVRTPPLSVCWLPCVVHLAFPICCLQVCSTTTAVADKYLLPAGVLRWRTGQGGPAEAVRCEPWPCHKTTRLLPCPPKRELFGWSYVLARTLVVGWTRADWLPGFCALYIARLL